MEDKQLNETVEEKETNVEETSGKAQDQTEAQRNTERKEEISSNEKTYGDALRRIFNVADGEELTELDEKITAFEKHNAGIIENAKNQIISAELKTFTGYDTKLLDRLIDRSKITFDESGRLVGVDEAVKQVETEFPSVKRNEHKPFMPANPESSFDTGKKMSLQEAMSYANEHPGTDINTLIF